MAASLGGLGGYPLKPHGRPCADHNSNPSAWHMARPRAYELWNGGGFSAVERPWQVAFLPGPQRMGPCIGPPTMGKAYHPRQRSLARRKTNKKLADLGSGFLSITWQKHLPLRGPKSLFFCQLFQALVTYGLGDSTNARAGHCRGHLQNPNPKFGSRPNETRADHRILA